MNIVSVLVASVIGIMAVMFTFQGLASASHSQALLKRKTDLVIEVQGVNNVLQDVAACSLSNGKQAIYYKNGAIAYQPDTVIASFAWNTIGSATTLTIHPKQPNLASVTLNLDCNAASSASSASSASTGDGHVVPITSQCGLLDGIYYGYTTDNDTLYIYTDSQCKNALGTLSRTSNDGWVNETTRSEWRIFKNGTLKMLVRSY